MKYQVRLGAALAAISLAACSGSAVQQSLVPPTKTTVNPVTGTTLQFAVGTANIAGQIGLNTLVTLRQNTGPYVGTSILSNAPTITGPAGFTVPAGAPDAYGDAGTAAISAFVPTSIASPPPQTTFDPDGGGSAQGNWLASSYGFFPGVVGNSGETPALSPGAMPFYSSLNTTLGCGTCSGPLEYIGGPPAFVPPGHTSTQDGTFAGGYAGYTLGFVDFQATPVTGSYALNVVIPTGINGNGVESYGSKAAAASLTATNVLPPWTTAPTFVSDGTGGGTITTNFGGGGGSVAPTEEYIILVNEGPGDCQLSGGAPYYYTWKVTPGTTTVTVPDDIGAAPKGKTQGHTLCTAADDAAGTGDAVAVYGFAVDYPLYASAFPQSNGKAAPVITTSGQDDVTTSAESTGTE
jgi:hypothetical protein